MFYSYSVSEITILETHISWVILTGPFAYKIKKPVDLGFLDFSTLTLRYQACLDVQSSLRTLKDRIAHRAEQRADASEATLSVLLQQQREKEPLGEDEQKVTITINSEESLDPRIIFQDLLKSKC